MRITAIAFVLLIVGAGCSSVNTPSMQVPVPKFKSELPAVGETKAVTFLIGYGATGGFGSMPVLLEDGTSRTIALAPVYFDESYAARVAKELPECYSGQPRIEVRATVTVEERRETNTSIPGAPLENFYVAAVQHLDSITVTAEPCSE